VDTGKRGQTAIQMRDLLRELRFRTLITLCAAALEAGVDEQVHRVADELVIGLRGG